MTKKEIEDYINNYRVYPDEYTGKRDKTLLVRMNSSTRYNPNDNTITRLEGCINDLGDFEIVGLYKFPIDDPGAKKPATELEHHYKFIINRYNNMMMDLGRAESVIDETKDTINWTLRDMLAEVEYVRSTYYDKDHPNSKLRLQDLKEFNRRTSRLRHFIRTYKDQVNGLELYTNHNSKYG